MGLQDLTESFHGELPQLLLITQLGELRTFGKDIPFLDRVLHRDHLVIYLHSPKPYAQERVGGTTFGQISANQLEL